MLGQQKINRRLHRIGLKAATPVHSISPRKRWWKKKSDGGFSIHPYKAIIFYSYVSRRPHAYVLIFFGKKIKHAQRVYDRASHQCGLVAYGKAGIQKWPLGQRW